MVFQFYNIFHFSEYHIKTNFLSPIHCHLHLDPMFIYHPSSQVLHILVYLSLVSDQCLIFFLSHCDPQVYLCNLSTVTVKFLYILIYLTLIVSDRSLKTTFFCYRFTVLVRFLYFDISIVTLKDILRYCTNVLKKNFFVNESVSPLILSTLLYQVSPSSLYILILEK